MEKSLPGLPAKRAAVVNIYADEIKPVSNSAGEKWMYLGLSVIEQDKHSEILESLENDRVKVGYLNPLHYSNITNHQKYLLARLWLERVKFDRWTDQVRPKSKGIYFYVLGLCLSRLKPAAFAQDHSQVEDNIYNRFFRAAISYAVMSFFGKNDSITVNNIFHHMSHLSNHRLFNWHSIKKTREKFPQINFSNQRIRFLEDDHRISKVHADHSPFIQLTDVILGASREVLDFSSKKSWKMQTGRVFLPLVSSVIEQRRADLRRFSCQGRVLLRFFPARTEMHDSQFSNNFYLNRKMLLPADDHTQLEMML